MVDLLLDYYFLGSQYVTHWLHFRVPVYELKACCVLRVSNFCFLSC